MFDDDHWRSKIWLQKSFLNRMRMQHKAFLAWTTFYKIREFFRIKNIERRR